MYKTSRLVRISILINALKKRVLLFSEESYFIKAMENFVFAYPDINTRRVGRILDSYANPRHRILPTPLVFISGYANTENVFYCLNRFAFIILHRFHYETILGPHYHWSDQLALKLISLYRSPVVRTAIPHLRNGRIVMNNGILLSTPERFLVRLALRPFCQKNLRF